MNAEILMVRYNQPELEARCIRSVEQHTNLKQHQFTVLDNYQRDKNLGALWNERIARSKADAIVLLNSDTTVEPQWLDRLMDCAERTKAGAVGPLTDHCGTPVQLQPRGAGQQEVPQLSGFCLLLAKEAWEKARGFREDAPFYGQESNLLLRIKRKMLCREVFVHHEAGGSVRPTGRALEERELARPWWFQNTRFNWQHRLAILGSPTSPFPLWRGINQALAEFRREGLESRHLEAATFRADQLRDFAPTVILLVSQRWQTIAHCAEQLRQFPGIPKACWFNDLRPGTDAHVTKGLIDHIFLCFKDSSKFSWSEWQRQSRGKVHYMPQGSVINTQLEPLRLRHEVLFIGGTTSPQFHADRKPVIRCLRARVLNESLRDRRIKVEEASREHYRQTRFALSMSPRIPGYTSIRLYNIMAYGGLALLAKFPGCETLLRDREHALVWNTEADAQRLVSEWTKKEAECEVIRKRAWRLQQAKHTVANRIMNMVANMTTADQSFWGTC